MGPSASDVGRGGHAARGRPSLPDDLPEGLLHSLKLFRQDLLQFNQSRNLLSRRRPGVLADQLLWEAVATSRALPFVPGQHLLDLGSGAGLPGIPLAVLRPELQVTLLERRTVRCDFLRRELLVLKLGNARVLEGDAVDWSLDAAESANYQWVCLKAVAPPAEALGLALPFLAPGGTAVIFAREDMVDAGDLEEAGWEGPRAIRLSTEESVAPPSSLLLFRQRD